MRINYNNGYYEGQVLYDEPNGYGAFYWNNGDWEEGFFSNGNLQRGKYHFANGVVYEGPFDSDGRFHGKGKKTYKDGDTYTGDFYHGVETGYGIYRWHDGGYLEGQFKNFKIQRGKRVFSSGDTYEGTFDENENLHGKGKYCFSDGFMYEGDWFHGERTGYGVIWSTKDKYRYEGHFLNGLRDGHGKVRYSNEDDRVYEGNFKEGKRNGKFTITFDNGKKIERVYEDDNIADGIIENIDENGETNYYYYKNGDFFGL